MTASHLFLHNGVRRLVLALLVMRRCNEQRFVARGSLQQEGLWIGNQEGLYLLGIGIDGTQKAQGRIQALQLIQRSFFHAFRVPVIDACVAGSRCRSRAVMLFMMIFAPFAVAATRHHIHSGVLLVEALLMVVG